MSYETVEYKREGKIAYITLNRPQVLNAMSQQLQDDLKAALFDYDMDEEAWVAILHGAGRSFCAGFDIKQRFVDMDRRDRALNDMGPDLEGFLGRCANWKPVIAAVHGYALGIGMTLVLECDLIVATEDAQFGITETKRGVSGGRVWAKAQSYMPSKINTEMLLTGASKPASELHRLGFINRLAPEGKHLEAAEELAGEILEAAPLAVRSGVRLARWSWLRLVSEADFYMQGQPLHLTEDFKEASQAFAEKRKPAFRGR